MLRTDLFTHVGAFACALVLGSLCPLSSAQGGALSVLHTFDGPPNDGELPQGSLIQDGAGNFYGTTLFGGSGNPNLCSYGGCGTVFKLSPEGVESVLYSFCTQTNCADGADPQGNLVEDSAGNFYGTTAEGGAYGWGTVFEITPSGAENILYNFCSQPDCADGSFPTSGLIIDQFGNLYGTTASGGSYCSGGCGTVYELSPSGDETVLHAFAGLPSDGAEPEAALYMDSAGNLYGTTYSGGISNGSNCNIAAGCGTVFEIQPDGSETVLHSFCAQVNCADGALPWAGLIMDSSDNLYGTTEIGGGTGCAGGGCGTVFKLTPDGAETVMYSFCSEINCTDGSYPIAGVIESSKGELYGTTTFGGPNNGGTIFEISSKKGEHVLSHFNYRRAKDGVDPQASLISDTSGYLYGTAFYGGNDYCDRPDGCGVVFKRKE
jgi:uncharacterized repeat protein (TIGR03803 family)